MIGSVEAGVSSAALARLANAFDGLEAVLFASSASQWADMLEEECELPTALDRLLTVTRFDDQFGRTKREVSISLRKMVQPIQSRTAANKRELPWLKFARFGNLPTGKGSLRHDANVLSIDGVEADYDAEQMSVDEALSRLHRADLAALLYTSPSHTNPARARFRILCPTSKSLPPSERERLVARLNGVFGGSLARESFTRSQAYYYGSVNSNPAHRIELTEGRCIDSASDLDAGALGRDGSHFSAPPLTAQASMAPAIPGTDDWAATAHAEPDWSRMRAALEAIPAAARDDREACWRPIGMAIHQETGGSEEGFYLWEEWSQASIKHDARDQRRVWISFGARDGKGVGIGTLYHLAQRHGWDPKARQMPVVQATADASTLRFFSPDECASAPSRGYVVKGILAPRDVGCIFGAPGAGKSLISPHVGYMVAQGLPAFGMKTRAGGVFYVAAEDPHGMQGRVAALKLAHGDAPSFTLVAGVSDLLSNDGADLVALRAAVAERKPTLIFLDTVAMAFPGLEENKAEAMSRVVAVARSLTADGAAVVLIHHDTKGESNTPRGHSVLNGALDMALHLVPRDESGVVRGKLTKNRNGACDRDIAFRIAAREMGTDEDGDPITAALAEELAPGSEPKAEKLAPSEAAAMATLADLVKSEGQQQPDGRVTVLEVRWREECDSTRRVSGSEKPDNRRRVIDRTISNLTRKGRVEVRGGVAWAPPVLVAVTTAPDWPDLSEVPGDEACDPPPAWWTLRISSCGSEVP